MRLVFTARPGAGYAESHLHQAAGRLKMPGLVGDKGRIYAPGLKLSFFSSKTSEETRSAAFCLSEHWARLQAREDTTLSARPLSVKLEL